jgi:hypothetical protein
MTDEGGEVVVSLALTFTTTPSNPPHVHVYIQISNSQHKFITRLVVSRVDYLTLRIGNGSLTSRDVSSNTLKSAIKSDCHVYMIAPSKSVRLFSRLAKFTSGEFEFCIFCPFLLSWFAL